MASISSSVTASAVPPVVRMATRAFSALTGAPIRIAVATVSGCSSGTTTGRLSLIARTIGIDPAACIPVIIGSRSMNPISCSSRSPL